MWEWLPRDEWYDVQLLCGGRCFNAHRAVLASVSSFLREVLLSCPEKSPVFIMSPEFDSEVVSFILYYIYNGEVRIPKQKFNMFLDTASAMKIFIDQRHIKAPTKSEHNDALSERSDKRFTLENYNMCYLRNNVENYKKIECFTRQMRSIGSTFVQDKANEEIYSRSENNVTDVENLTYASAYRDSQSFLRDIFIETYIRYNKSPGMQAVSNKNNGAPKSVILAGYNEIYHSASDLLIDIPKDASPYIIKKSMFNAFTHLQPGDDKQSNKIHVTTIPNEACNQFNDETFNFDRISEDVMDNADAVTKKSNNVLVSGILDEASLIKGSTNSRTEKSTIAKVILNEVLQNPWHPQQPNNYRPFPRKNIKPLDSDKRHENEIFTKRKDYGLCMKHRSGTRYHCEECDKTFSQLRNFKYHMSVHRGTKEFATTCPICGKHFNDRGYLSNHLKIHRNRKEYKCTSCPKSFNQRVAFNMHVRIHTGVKPHVCEECGKAFSRKMLLKQHQRTHSGERPYACTHCDRRFADRSNMTLHLRLHTGVKPFSCTLCPKSFTKKHHLKSHLNFHTGVKPYSCPRCKVAFTQSSNMRTHLKKCNAIN